MHNQKLRRVKVKIREEIFKEIMANNFSKLFYYIYLTFWKRKIVEKGKKGSEIDRNLSRGRSKSWLQKGSMQEFQWQ